MLPEGLKKEDAIAFLRYNVISPLLDAQKGEILKTVESISKNTYNDVVNQQIVSFSQRQIFRFYKAYKDEGFLGLKPKIKASSGTHPSVTSETINEILSLKKELITRSSYKVIRILEISNRVEVGKLQPRTVSRILKQYGYTRENLSKDTRVYVKHEKQQVNEMWISDVMEGCYIDFNGVDKKLCYLIGFQDDCSRVITHAQFYFDSTLPKLEDTLRKAVTKFGVPSRLYIDNGKIYVADNFRLICAKLGIKNVYSTPYHPQGKGKKEKFWDYVQKSFLSEIRLRRVSSITELNDLFFAWLKAEYLDKPHASLDKEITPNQRWNLSIHSGTKIFLKSPTELDEIFLHEATRTVTKYGVIRFEGNTYEIPSKLVGKKVIVLYDPFDLSKLKIYFDGKYIDTAKVIDLNKTKHKDVENVVIEPKVDTEISRLYFENLKVNYALYLDNQLKAAKDRSFLETTTKPVLPEDDKESHRPAIKDKLISFSLEDFNKLIAVSINELQLSYIEKSRLYEIWRSLKDFDPEIFKGLLTEVQTKVPDYNANFIYYVEQIKNLYLDRRTSL